MNNSAESDSSQTPIEKYITQQLLDCAKIAQELNADIDSAKTNTKKRMLKKRLTKNNEMAVELLMGMERMKAQRSTASD